MIMQNSRGLRILPCGTPVCIVPKTDSFLFAYTHCDLFEIYD